MKITTSTAATLLAAILLISQASCFVIVPTKKDNGLHKGWYKNPHNPHNPNSNNPGQSKGKSESHGNSGNSGNSHGNSNGNSNGKGKSKK